jgi:N-acetylglucosamine kinase-like BadF-type ATPase
MNGRGELWRTDGWDYILGDAGSGYYIGASGIRAAMKALDGRAGHTLLVRLLGETYGIRSAEAMRRLVDSTQFGKFEMAAFAIHVSAAADAGDATAQHILHDAGMQLAENAIAIIHKLEMSDGRFPLSTVGSVLQNKWVAGPFQEAIGPYAPQATFVPPRHPPEVGAAIMTRRRLQSGDTGSWTIGTGQRRIRRSATVDEVGYA